MVTTASFIARRVGNISAVLADIDSSLPDVRMPDVLAWASAADGDGRPLASELLGAVIGATAVLSPDASCTFELPPH